jgi:uncharacterized protein YndB with AHSA1/START domain
MTNEVATVHIVRLLDAPRERVWQAWTDPEELARWWWPQRFETTYEVDLQEGGTYRFRTIDLPDMGTLDLSGTFLGVLAPERLAYTWQWLPDDHVTHVTVELTDLGRRTELCVRHHELVSPEDRENHTKGWNDCLDRLGPYVA